MSTSTAEVVPPPPSALRNFAINVAAGGFAGMAEILAMYPLDVVKTRLQLQSLKTSALAAGEAPVYTSVAGTIKTIIKQEGLSNLYRGIWSPIFAEAPKRACKFACNEQYKSWFADKDGNLNSQRRFAAGGLAGMTEAIVNCPFEVVKVRMQAKENLTRYTSTSQATLSILKTEGVTALYSGLEAQLWRNAMWNGTFFALAFELKTMMGEQDTKGKRMARDFTAGVIAGGLGTCFNTPFDVVKSRMQNQLGVPGEKLKYRNAIQSVGVVFREEGFRACYKGLVPRMMRLGPGGGIILVAFDFFVDLFGGKKRV